MLKLFFFALFFFAEWITSQSFTSVAHRHSRSDAFCTTHSLDVN